MSLVSLRNLIDPSVTRALLGDRRISATASVVLPDPLSPMIASVSPFPSSNETLRTALTGPRRLKYWMERSSTESTGAPVARLGGAAAGAAIRPTEDAG